jgi:hypothetical protein
MSGGKKMFQMRRPTKSISIGLKCQVKDKQKADVEFINIGLIFSVFAKP